VQEVLLLFSGAGSAAAVVWGRWVFGHGLLTSYASSCGVSAAASNFGCQGPTTLHDMRIASVSGPLGQLSLVLALLACHPSYSPGV